MAKTKPEYQSLDEFTDIASQLIAKYPEVFAGLDISSVKCVAITNQERPEKKKFWTPHKVEYPARMDCPYSYYMVVYMSDWDLLDEAHKAAVVADALHSIPSEEGKEGKLNPFDMKAYRDVERTLGIDWEDTDTIPNLLKDNVKWVSR